MSLLLLWLPASDAAPCVGAPAGAVVLNELFPDPDGADAGLEWVELYNTSAAEVRIGGWVIAAGTSVYGTSDPLPPAAVEAGGWLVVEPMGISLGNAGSNSDAVQLRDCAGIVVDTIVYGAPNTDGWLDDQGREAEDLAPAPTTGHALGRVPDGADSDGGAHVVDLPVPSPGASNVAAAEACAGAGVVINELLPDPEGVDSGAEWVELLHAGDEAIDLGGWVLEAGTSALGVVYTFAEGSLEPGDRWVVGGPDGREAPELTLGNAAASSDVLRLVDCAGGVADTVLYGAPNTDGFADDAVAPAVASAPAPATGEALHRVPDGQDTDDSAVDFVVTRTPTPGGPNVAPEAPEPAAPSEGCGGPDPPAPGCTTGAAPASGWVAALVSVRLLRRRRRR